MATKTSLIFTIQMTLVDWPIWLIMQITYKKKSFNSAYLCTEQYLLLVTTL